MRFVGVLASGFVAVCLLVPLSGDVVAGDAKKPTVKKPAAKKASGTPVPARPTGIPLVADSGDAYYGGSRNDTITEYQNELGQTVYSISASHFDVSPPLRELVTVASREQETDEEPSSNPQIPAARIPRSTVPDPVVQVAVQPEDSYGESFAPLAAPTTGFNFLGVGINGGTPSDSNGSVGTTQFVETVNTRYQVWTLNRATLTATPVLGPAAINSLWAGFGGACEQQNSGDPIVLFDKTAKRWLISQFTSASSGGVFYQCAAISATADATGSYARYAFAVPNGKFGDYPHFGVWPPYAYTMMAHGFGGQFVAIFAAMDRSRMLAANAAATWQVIQDPNEGGHMPADVDGFAYPPTAAPGIFVSLHDEGMYIYRMKFTFAGPGTSSISLQAIVPTAPATAACFGGTCLPQPGTTNRLDAISDRLMYRAAYRNYIDHESLVVSHSVNPSVAGVVSGVRWYDIRLSGNADSTCPTFPCLYQQGTIADVPGGRSRWMSSIAMDDKENMLVGYTTTGIADGTDNHSLRYTGRAKADPPGTMTAPESTIVTGTANNIGNTRWGDYSSMSVDPVDDCTFWYVGQYYAATNSWSTRVASARFPAGNGAGQCASSTCTTPPFAAPVLSTATAPVDNQILVTWTPPTPTPAGYAVERAEGVCGSEGLYRPLAAIVGSATSFTDNSVMGGIAYSYHVRTATDATGRCQAQFASGCLSATATGSCTLKPTFAGATFATSSGQSNCGITINWTSGASNCPLASNVRYNTYRSIAPSFVPSPANRIAACVVGPSAYLDSDNLASLTTYYYIVRAESFGNGVACGSGNEDSNTVTVGATPDQCVPNTCPGQPDGSSCDDGNGCSIGDACTGGSCAGVPIATPPETQNVQAQPDKATYVWDAAPNTTRYDALRGSLTAFPVGPGEGDELCFDDLASEVLIDSTVPSPGTGFWYVSRAESACSNGSYGQQSDGTPRITGTCP